MQIAVLVERVRTNGYRAHGGEPFGVSAEGATREEAIAKVQQLFQARVNSGAEVVTVEVKTSNHPLMPFAGMFKYDPDFQDVLDIIAENRRKMDEDPDVL